MQIYLKKKMNNFGLKVIGLNPSYLIKVKKISLE